MWWRRRYRIDQRQSPRVSGCGDGRAGSVGGVYKGKVVVTGDYGVGKTSLAQRFVHEAGAPGMQQPTIGAAFFTKNIVLSSSCVFRAPGAASSEAVPVCGLVRLEVWDTAGSERYRALMPMYYRDATCCIVCYDICDAKSFNSVQGWVENFNKHSGRPTDGVDARVHPSSVIAGGVRGVGSGSIDPLLLLLVGTKVDLADVPSSGGTLRQVPTAEAQALAQRLGMLFFECSALNDVCVQDIFLAAAQHTAARELLSSCEDLASSLLVLGSRDTGKGATAQRVRLQCILDDEDPSTSAFVKRRTGSNADHDQSCESHLLGRGKCCSA